MSDGGKGSAPRPYSVSSKEYSEKWDAIFGSKDEPRKLNDGYDQRENLKRAPYYVAGIVLIWVVGLLCLLP